MDQNVIQKIKSLYKNKLLIHIISQDGDVTQSLKGLNLKDVVFSLAHAWDSVSPNLLQSSWKKLWPTMNDVSETEETNEWDTEDNVPIADWVQNLSEKGLETTEENLNSWFEGIEETEEIMTDEEIVCEAVQEESSVEILEPPTTTTAVRVKPDDAMICFNTCIPWAEENGISAKDIIILRNMREKVFKQELKVAQKQTSVKDYFKSSKLHMYLQVNSKHYIHLFSLGNALFYLLPMTFSVQPSNPNIAIIRHPPVFNSAGLVGLHCTSKLSEKGYSFRRFVFRGLYM